jgi:hypothetical protein
MLAGSVDSAWTDNTRAGAEMFYLSGGSRGDRHRDLRFDCIVDRGKRSPFAAKIWLKHFAIISPAPATNATKPSASDWSDSLAPIIGADHHLARRVTMSNSRTLADLAISDNGFIFDPLAGATFSVNATGLCVLQSLKEGLGQNAIARRLVERFAKATSDAARDVDEFVHQLRQHNLVSPDFSAKG